MANSLILAKAQNAVTSHDWTTAARYYKELLRSDESNVEYLQQLGSIYVRAGQDEKAIPYYEQIITFNSNNTSAMISLGGIFRRLKRYEDSVAILHKAQDIEAGSATINYNLGFTYKEMGDYEDAIDAFESVISKNPNDVLAHNHLGSIYCAQKDYDKSIAAFKKGLQVDQNHPILNFNLAHVYEDIKNYPESVRCYEIALKTRPGWVEAIRDFSELLIKCQNTKHAQELVEQSIKLHPDDVELLCILGRIYLNQFDYDNATKTFKRAENLKENDINILIGLSKALEKGTKIDQAMEKILEAVDIESENLEVCKQYAHVLLSAQRYDKALEMIKAIDSKSDGKDLQILDLYGQYFVCRGDEEAANTYFEKIKKINHHYKDYMVNAADRYIQTGNYEKAEKFAEAFVERRPQLPDGYNILGTVETARGNLSKAKAEYEKGIGLKNPNIYAVKELEKIYSELEKNQELYNDDHMPVGVDADSLSKEDGGNIDDSLNEASVDGAEDQLDALMDGAVSEEAEETEKEEFDYSSMEKNPPIEQALTGEDGDFWEDFDDDPDAKDKLIDEDEEPAYDENSDDSDLMSMMTPDAADEDDEEADELMSDFMAPKDPDAEESLAAEPETAPVAEAPAAPVEEAPVEEPAPVESPASTESLVPEESPAPIENPAPAESSAPIESSVPAESPAPAAGNLRPELEKAEQMMNDLKQQQKELELQQRELALKNREMADEIKQENEKMIHDAVDKAVDEAVDKAVEEKFQEYDWPVEASEPVVESEPEESTEPAEEEAPAEEVVPVEEEPLADEEVVSEEEVPVEEEQEPMIDEDLEITEDEIAFLNADDFLPFDEDGNEISADDSDIDSESDNVIVPFVTVEELNSLCGGSADAVSEEAAPEVAEPEVEEDDDDSFVTADDMLEKIERILNDDDTAKAYEKEIELFKKLRVLSDFLPEKEKNSVFTYRIKILIEYVIARMSGKPGLLRTAESLIKSGVLGEEYSSQLDDVDEELSNDLIVRVIKEMKELAQNLKDKDLCNALCVTADGILEQIMLINQKCQIF